MNSDFCESAILFDEDFFRDISEWNASTPKAGTGNAEASGHSLASPKLISPMGRTTRFFTQADEESPALMSKMRRVVDLPQHASSSSSLSQHRAHEDNLYAKRSRLDDEWNEHPVHSKVRSHVGIEDPVTRPSCAASVKGSPSEDNRRGSENSIETEKYLRSHELEREPEKSKRKYAYDGSNVSNDASSGDIDNRKCSRKADHATVNAKSAGDETATTDAIDAAGMNCETAREIHAYGEEMDLKAYLESFELDDDTYMALCAGLTPKASAGPTPLAYTAQSGAVISAVAPSPRAEEVVKELNARAAGRGGHVGHVGHAVNAGYSTGAPAKSKTAFPFPTPRAKSRVRSHSFSDETVASFHASTSSSSSSQAAGMPNSAGSSTGPNPLSKEEVDYILSHLTSIANGTPCAASDIYSPRNKHFWGSCATTPHHRVATARASNTNFHKGINPSSNPNPNFYKGNDSSTSALCSAGNGSDEATSVRSIVSDYREEIRSADAWKNDHVRRVQQEKTLVKKGEKGNPKSKKSKSGTEAKSQTPSPLQIQFRQQLQQLTKQKKTEGLAALSPKSLGSMNRRTEFPRASTSVQTVARPAPVEPIKAAASDRCTQKAEYQDGQFIDNVATTNNIGSYPSGTYAAANNLNASCMYRPSEPQGPDTDMSLPAKASQVRMSPLRGYTDHSPAVVQRPSNAPSTTNANSSMPASVSGNQRFEKAERSLESIAVSVTELLRLSIPLKQSNNTKTGNRTEPTVCPPTGSPQTARDAHHIPIVEKHEKSSSEQTRPSPVELTPLPTYRIDGIAQELSVHVRRVYDVVNILQVLHMVVTETVGRIRWAGLGDILDVLASMQADAIHKYPRVACATGLMQPMEKNTNMFGLDIPTFMKNQEDVIQERDIIYRAEGCEVAYKDPRILRASVCGPCAVWNKDCVTSSVIKCLHYDTQRGDRTSLTKSYTTNMILPVANQPDGHEDTTHHSQPFPLMDAVSCTVQGEKEGVSLQGPVGADSQYVWPAVEPSLRPLLGPRVVSLNSSMAPSTSSSSMTSRLPSASPSPILTERKGEKPIAEDVTVPVASAVEDVTASYPIGSASSGKGHANTIQSVHTASSNGLNAGSGERVTKMKAKLADSLCARFLMLFLVGHNHLSIQDAFRLLEEADSSDSKAPRSGGIKSVEEPKQGSSPADMSTQKLQPGNKKVRRLNDIANVLCTIGLLTKYISRENPRMNVNSRRRVSVMKWNGHCIHYIRAYYYMLLSGKSNQAAVSPSSLPSSVDTAQALTGQTVEEAKGPY